MENMLQLDLFDFDNEVMEIAPEPQPVRTEPRTELPLHATIGSDRTTNCFRMGRKVKSTATSRQSAPSKRWKKPEKPPATPIVQLC